MLILFLALCFTTFCLAVILVISYVQNARSRIKELEDSVTVQDETISKLMEIYYKLEDSQKLYYYLNEK